MEVATPRNNTKLEDAVMTAMIVDQVVLGQIAPHWTDDGLFDATWPNIVGRWCVDYFKDNNEAPKHHITNMFAVWEEEHPNDTANFNLINKYLTRLNDQYKDFEDAASRSNSTHLLDMANRVFQRSLLERHVEEVGNLLDRGKTKKARLVVEQFQPLSIGQEQTHEPSAYNENEVTDVLAYKQESIVSYTYALKHFFGDSLHRGSFLAFLAPEKTGKSWILMDLAFRSITQGLNVAFFEAGDMTKQQWMKRWLTRVAKHPNKPQSIFIPRVMHVEGYGSEIDIEQDEKVFDVPINQAIIRKGYSRLRSQCKQNGTHLGSMKMENHPSSTLSVSDINAKLDLWERNEGWLADVVIIDYVDILASEGGFGEDRNQINRTWKMLRSLSQARNCLLVTATQADAASYNLKNNNLLNRSNFSEDKRKLAHVTGMIGLQRPMGLAAQHPELLLWNWIVRRDAEADESKAVYVTGCRAIGNPNMLSSYG